MLNPVPMADLGCSPSPSRVALLDREPGHACAVRVLTVSSPSLSLIGRTRGSGRRRDPRVQPTRHKSNNEWAAAPNSRMAKGSAASPGHLMTEEGEGPAGGCPVRVKELPPGEEARLVTLGFKGYTGLVRTQPGGMLMKARYKEMAPRFYNFAFRPDDIVVMTYPKCGTTWMQEILWGMTHLDELDEADRLPITKRTYFIDSDALYQLEDQMKDRFLMERFRALCPSARPDRGILLQSCGAQPPHPSKPRIIKTHFPFSLYRPDLLDRCRVVYVCRNPKDACVSYHHHCRLINTYKFEGSFETFAGCFMAGDVFYGRFWDHVAAAWERRRQPSSALRLLRGPPAPGPATASETLAGLGSLRSFALRQGSPYPTLGNYTRNDHPSSFYPSYTRPYLLPQNPSAISRPYAYSTRPLRTSQARTHLIDCPPYFTPPFTPPFLMPLLTPPTSPPPLLRPLIQRSPLSPLDRPLTPQPILAFPSFTP
ncbi:estrogen sulfotransferase [Penaeus vannamei]|uniref:Estrogen sulfotransferase n=1 Tax=Penaeus vannamei TaxID=6689 RepID=A0A3R7N903_PENVA|nr:estrogen sulfotransferase [Penaeus vannamei]